MQPKTKNDAIFLKLISDDTCYSIMSLTSKKEYSASDLSEELQIPISTIYRKLKVLTAAEFLQIVKTLVDRAGNQEDYYRCIVNKATVNFSNGEISVNLQRLDYTDEFVLLWKKLAEGSTCLKNRIKSK